LNDTIGQLILINKPKKQSFVSHYRRVQEVRGSDIIDGDAVVISSVKRDSDPNATGLMNANSPSANVHDTRQNSLDEPFNRDRRNTTTGLNFGGGNIFSKFRGIFNPGMINTSNDKLYRTSTFCVSASIPTREVHHWVKTFILMHIRSSYFAITKRNFSFLTFSAKETIFCLRKMN